MRSIELFTGAGGLALGTHRAGFHHLAVIEWDKDSCNTLRHNRKREGETGVDWPIHECDVTNFDYEPYPDGIDLLAGGAPCQPFSLGGKHRGHRDERNMFPEVFRAVRELHPRAFLLENVKGLTRESFKPYFEYIIAQLTLPYLIREPEEEWESHKGRLDSQLQKIKSGGELPLLVTPYSRYDVQYKIYSVADFGVPQDRHRVFIVGFRHDLYVHWIFPKPTHSMDALLYAQYVDRSYWKDHNIEPRPVPERWAKRVAFLAKYPKPNELRWRTVRDAISDLPEPIDFDPKPSIDNHVGIPDARSYPGHTGSDWDWPAKTIKAGDHGNPGGENMLRREDGTVRYFTTRELARLQTFPDVWEFENSWTENRRQLGNAVPVLMAEKLAKEIYISLEQIDDEKPKGKDSLFVQQAQQGELWPR